MLRYLPLLSLLMLPPIEASSPAQLPARFEPLSAQGSAWTAKGFGYTALFSPSSVDLESRAGGRLRVTFDGAAADASMRGLDPYSFRSFYFRGSDPQRRRRDVPEFARLRVNGVYPGVDVEYYRGAHGLESDFRVAPRGDPFRIRLRFEGRRVGVDEKGSLRDKDTGEWLLAAPIVYQETPGGSKQFVASAFQIEDNGRVSFHIGKWDRSRVLVIDPVLTYATFFGGSGIDTSAAIERGPDGSIYLTGSTTSVDLPQAVSLDSILNRPVVLDQPDVFVAHYTPDGSSLAYIVYVGGDLSDTPMSLAVDSLGRATVVGYSSSPNFPITTGGALDGRGLDAFVFRLTADGSALDYSTFLGVAAPGLNALFSSLPQLLVGIDGSGAAIVAGTSTGSGSYRGIVLKNTAGTLQPNPANGSEAFLIHLSADGTSTQWATYYGGSGDEVALGLTVDPSGNLYLVGTTTSNNLVLRNPFQAAPPTQPPPSAPYLEGDTAGFFAKISADGRSLLAASYFGGQKSNSSLNSLAIDSMGNVYLAGSSPVSAAPGLVAAPGPQPSYGVNYPPVIVKLDPSGSIPQYMWAYSYLQANGVNRIRVDGSQRPCILTQFSSAAPTPGALLSSQDYTNGPGFACFNQDGKTPLYVTLVPGTNFSTTGVDFAIAPDGTVIGAGSLNATTQNGSPTTTANAPQPSPGGSTDVYVFEIGPQNPVPQLYSVSPPLISATGSSAAVSLVGSNFSQGMTVLWNGAPLTASGFNQLQPALFSFQISAATFAQTPMGDVQVQLSVPGPGGGTSNSVILRYVNPAPGLINITPSVVPVGSAQTTFTIVGTLAANCTVTWNGIPQTLTPAVLGRTGFTFTIPASALASAGSAVVAATNPSPGGGTSSAQVQITPTGLPAQIPAITSPVVVGVGEGGTTQSINVSGVQSDATVVWNGSDRPTTFVSANTLQFALALSDVSQMGSAQVQIRSGGVLGPAVTAYIGLRAASAHLVADPARNQAYFATANAANKLQSVAAVAIPSGAVLRTADLGAAIVSIVKTDDNDYLWVVTADGKIQRVNIDTFAVDLSVTLPASPNFNSYPVVVPVAGSSTSIVAGGTDGILHIFDSGTEREFNSSEMLVPISGDLIPVFATPDAVWATATYSSQCWVRLTDDYTGFNSFEEVCGAGPSGISSPEVAFDSGVIYFQSGPRTQVWSSPIPGIVDLANRRILQVVGRQVNPSYPGGYTSLANLAIYDLDSDAQTAFLPQSGYLPFESVIPYTSSQVLFASGFVLVVDLPVANSGTARIDKR